MIRCEFKWCIYNKESECTIKEIEINSLGMCDKCIMPNIEAGVLEEAKEGLLRKYDKEEML
ncbi:MAG: hypothetical protein FWE03_03270 [Firmicutes bacterium]|nr:hypothetical protein [Bacillota bacterium]